MKRCPVSCNDGGKMPGYRRDSQGESVMANPRNYVLNLGRGVASLIRLVTQERTALVVFSPGRWTDNTPCQGLRRPSTDGVPVAGTDARQPSSSGRAPKAVGQSTRSLPGNSRRAASRWVG